MTRGNKAPKQHSNPAIDAVIESGASGNIAIPAATVESVDDFENNRITEVHVAFRADEFDKEAHAAGSLTAGFSRLAHNAISNLNRINS